MLSDRMTDRVIRVAALASLCLSPAVYNPASCSGVAGHPPALEDVIVASKSQKLKETKKKRSSKVKKSRKSTHKKPKKAGYNTLQGYNQQEHTWHPNWQQGTPYQQFGQNGYAYNMNQNSGDWSRFYTVCDAKSTPFKDYVDFVLPPEKDNQELKGFYERVITIAKASDPGDKAQASSPSTDELLVAAMTKGSKGLYKIGGPDQMQLLMAAGGKKSVPKDGFEELRASMEGITANVCNDVVEATNKVLMAFSRYNCGNATLDEVESSKRQLKSILESKLKDHQQLKGLSNMVIIKPAAEVMGWLAESLTPGQTVMFVDLVEQETPTLKLALYAVTGKDQKRYLVFPKKCLKVPAEKFQFEGNKLQIYAGGQPFKLDETSLSFLAKKLAEQENQELMMKLISGGGGDGTIQPNSIESLLQGMLGGQDDRTKIINALQHEPNKVINALYNHKHDIGKMFFGRMMQESLKGLNASQKAVFDMMNFKFETVDSLGPIVSDIAMIRVPVGCVSLPKLSAVNGSPQCGNALLVEGIAEYDPTPLNCVILYKSEEACKKVYQKLLEGREIGIYGDDL